MAESRKFTAILELAGRINGSFSASMRKAVESLDKVQKATDKLSKGNHFAALAKNADTHFGHIEKRASKTGEFIRHALAYATGGFIKDAAESMLHHGVELLREGSKVYGEREQAQVLMGNFLENKGFNAAQQKGFLDMLLRFGTNESKVGYVPSVEASQMLMNTGRFKGVEDLHTFLSMFADIGGDPSKSKLGLMAITKMMSEGKIEGRHLNELAVDMPQVPWYQEIAKLRHEDVGKLRKEMAKKGASIDAGVLMQVLQGETGKGGAFYHHAAAQMETWSGLLHRAGQDWDIILSKVGKLEEMVLGPTLSHFLGGIDPVSLSNSLDRFVGKAQTIGENLRKAFDTLSTDGTFEDMWKRIKSISSGVVGDIRELLHTEKGASTQDTIVSILHKIDDSLKWIDKHRRLVEAGFMTLFALRFGGGLLGSLNTLLSTIKLVKEGLTGITAANTTATATAVGTGVASWVARLLPAVSGATLAYAGARTALATTKDANFYDNPIGRQYNGALMRAQDAALAISSTPYMERAQASDRTSGWLNGTLDEIKRGSDSAGQSLGNLPSQVDTAGSGLKSALDGVQAALNEAAAKIRSLQIQAPQVQQSQPSIDRRSMAYSFS
jgi:hypothetical protein